MVEAAIEDQSSQIVLGGNPTKSDGKGGSG
jgi:hypothetical protein